MANSQLIHVLVALGSVLVVTRVFGALFRRLGQPRVIGEVAGGILLGPSLLGRIAPEAATYVLPATTAPFLSVLAQLGIIFYMFLIGLELDFKTIKKSGGTAFVISNLSIVLPFGMGAGLAWFLFEEFAPQGTTFPAFAIFLGVSLSVTAFPVLARILEELKIHKTKLGTLALTCAAIGDVTAWCLLALAVSVVKSSTHEAAITAAATFGFIAAMIFLGRPLVAWLIKWFAENDDLSESGVALVLAGVLASALATEAIGIHAIFGAFMLGVILPHDHKITHDLTAKFESLVRILFLPAFFAFTGMRTQIGLLENGHHALIALAIIAVAIIGKFGGTLIAARLTKNNWRDSTALGILMNTRGMVELIVLNIGLDVGVLTPVLFTMLVIMALVTTVMTSPLLRTTLKLKT